jgi:mono/diheme cytochrome c family protein
LASALALHSNHNKKMTKCRSSRDLPCLAPVFKWYCAACHGKNAKGNGPAASELKIPPPDLTTLAKRNKGKFPADYVTRVLVSGPKPAHGTPEMPIWGPLFAELNAKGRVTVEIDSVVHYLESLQEK